MVTACPRRMKDYAILRVLANSAFSVEKRSEHKKWTIREIEPGTRIKVRRSRVKKGRRKWENETSIKGLIEKPEKRRGKEDAWNAEDHLKV